MTEVHHALIHFQGHVQGVGFRYSALQIAREFEVAGTVENMPDGRVQIEAEGDAEQVAAFVAAVEDRMKNYIRKTERRVGTRVPQFSGFVIK